MENNILTAIQTLSLEVDEIAKKYEEISRRSKEKVSPSDAKEVEILSDRLSEIYFYKLYLNTENLEPIKNSLAAYIESYDRNIADLVSLYGSEEQTEPEKLPEPERKMLVEESKKSLDNLEVILTKEILPLARKLILRAQIRALEGKYRSLVLLS